jgi:hypothetical protein
MKQENNVLASRFKLYRHFVDVALNRGTVRAAVDVIENVIPLDDQLGVAKPLSVPNALKNAVLGPAEPATEAKVPATFAIIDAAKVINLPEILDASELRHACLFDGAAKAEMGSVAPWLVQLTDDHPLTRGLFSRGKGPLQLWDEAPGIFVRSDATFDAVRQHFRKFTKVRDGTGKWYFFRFWEPAFIAGLLRHGDPITIQRLLSIGAIQTSDPKRSTFTTYKPLAGVAENQRDAFILRDQDILALSDVKIGQFSERLKEWLQQTLGPFDDSLDMRSFAYGGITHARQTVGLHDEKSIADYVAACWLYGYPVETHAASQTAGLSPQRVEQLYRDALRLQTIPVPV